MGEVAEQKTDQAALSPEAQALLADLHSGDPERVSDAQRQVKALMDADPLPPFVHRLTTGATEVEPTTLDPHVQADLDRTLDAMRDAREAAAVSARDYIVHGSTRPGKTTHPTAEPDAAGAAGRAGERGDGGE